MRKRLTTEEWVKKARKVHGDRYDYSLVVYTGSKKKVKIICREHGVFECTPNNHVSNKSGCPKCKAGHMRELCGLGRESFITESDEKHSNFYDYSKVVYINNKTKVEIICPIHSSFFQTPNSHLSQGAGCPECGKVLVTESNRKSTEHFVKDSVKVHSTTYNYSLVEYTTSRTEVDIICNIHGIFKQKPMDHLSGCGCPECGIIKASNARKSSLEEFVCRSNKLHNFTFDYSLVEYVDGHTKVAIVCKTHGVFHQTPSSHLQGIGCRDCFFEKNSGEGHHWYKHGKTKEHAKERLTPENYQWTKLIKENKTQCDCCHEPFSEHTTPHAHHLNSWIDHPEERYDLNNGVAICEDCHWEFHDSYGYGGNTKEQYYQYKQLKQMNM